MPAEFIKFGDFARKQLGQQCQYACRYTGIDAKGNYNPEYWSQLGYQSCGDGLRFKGNTNNYHELMIHSGDVEVFKTRYRETICGVRPDNS